MSDVKPPGKFWPLILGGVGFAAGFFGPIVFVPEANQGPLVGIFLTGPGGFFLGLILYVATRIMQTPPALQWRILYSLSAILVLGTLFFVQPEPERKGEIVDIEVADCKSAESQIEKSIAHWQERIKQVTWAKPRAGWEEDLRKTLKTDSGIVLEAKVVRRHVIAEHRKPWNKGQLTAEIKSVKENADWFYISPEATCDQFPVGQRYSYFVSYDFSALTSPSRDWPPTQSPNLLSMKELRAIPLQYEMLRGQ